LSWRVKGGRIPSGEVQTPFPRKVVQEKWDDCKSAPGEGGGKRKKGIFLLFMRKGLATESEGPVYFHRIDLEELAADRRRKKEKGGKK